MNRSFGHGRRSDGGAAAAGVDESMSVAEGGLEPGDVEGGLHPAEEDGVVDSVQRRGQAGS